MNPDNLGTDVSQAISADFNFVIQVKVTVGAGRARKSGTFTSFKEKLNKESKRRRQKIILFDTVETFQMNCWWDRVFLFVLFKKSNLDSGRNNPVNNHKTVTRHHCHASGS